MAAAGVERTWIFCFSKTLELHKGMVLLWCGYLLRIRFCRSQILHVAFVF